MDIFRMINVWNVTETGMIREVYILYYSSLTSTLSPTTMTSDETQDASLRMDNLAHPSDSESSELTSFYISIF